MDKITNVMFMQSQAYFGSDSMIHSLLMRNLDRTRFEVHAACNRGTPYEESLSLNALKTIPALHLRPTAFGPTVNALPTSARVRNITTETLPGFADLTSLARYIRRNKINIIHGTEKPRDAFYGVVLAKMTGAKSIIHLHVGYDFWMSPLVR